MRGIVLAIILGLPVFLYQACASTTATPPMEGRYNFNGYHENVQFVESSGTQRVVQLFLNNLDLVDEI